MKAFVTRLRCGDHIVVRAGAVAEKYGDPYEWATVGEIEGSVVTLGAFAGRMSKPLAEAVLGSCFSEGFKEIRLDRLGQNPHQLVFTQSEGRIKMALPKAADANLSPSFKATAGAPKNPHGGDVAVAEAGALAWIAAMK